MAELRIAVLGLDRLGASLALSLRAYAKKGRANRFTLIGHDSRDDYESPARKLKVFDKIERSAYRSVEGADIVFMNLPYEDLRAGYEMIAPSLKEGALILDSAAIKRPSLAWAEQYLSAEHHLIGFTAVINADYLLEHQLSPEYASDDYFLHSPIYLTPSLSSIKEAIDLAVNFSAILGGKPHFLDPEEHDSLTTITEQIPQLLSIAAYASAMHHNAWGDAQRLTNPPFNVLTRYLLTHHPDALRDEWLANSERLTRALDDLLASLQAVRDRLAAGDESAIEAFIISASDDYQRWINKRHKGDWDKGPESDIQVDQTIAGTLFGGAISKRLFGDNKNNKK